jgi:hypothetical protein
MVPVGKLALQQTALTEQLLPVSRLQQNRSPPLLSSHRSLAHAAS